jgi:hypothetical protein
MFANFIVLFCFSACLVLADGVGGTDGGYHHLVVFCSVVNVVIIVDVCVDYLLYYV